MSSSSSSNIMIPLLLILSLFQYSNAANHIVGGPDGSWDMITDFKSWSSSNKFFTGDTLTFKYTADVHNVFEVTESDYDTCIGTNALLKDSSGSTVVTLDSPGNRYFICEIPGHCVSGMKVSVNVVASAKSASPPSPVAHHSSPPPVSSTSSPPPTVTTLPPPLPSTPPPSTTSSPPPLPSTPPPSTTSSPPPLPSTPPPSTTSSPPPSTSPVSSPPPESSSPSPASSMAPEPSTSPPPPSTSPVSSPPPESSSPSPASSMAPEPSTSPPPPSTMPAKSPASATTPTGSTTDEPSLASKTSCIQYVIGLILGFTILLHVC